MTMMTVTSCPTLNHFFLTHDRTPPFNPYYSRIYIYIYAAYAYMLDYAGDLEFIPGSTSQYLQYLVTDVGDTCRDVATNSNAN